MKVLTVFHLAALLQVVQPCILHGESGLRPAHRATQLSRRSEVGSQPGKYVLRNVRLFDGESISSPTTLFIDGQFISKPFTLATCASIQYIDAGNRILIPGLIDGHVHVPDVEGLENITSYGVTTAMNMACNNYTLCNYLRAYPQTTSGAGIASYFSAGLGATGPGSVHARVFDLTPDELVYPDSNATQLIEYAFNNGSDYYKIAAELNGPSEDMQIALVTEAHRLGQKVMTHASGIDAYNQAIASLTDGIQHIPDDGNLTLFTALNILKNGQYVTPTMNIFKVAFENPAVLAILRGNGSSSNETYYNVLHNVRLLREAGVPVLAGTDAVGPVVLEGISASIPLGLTMHWELENLVEAGYTPAQALRAATSDVAKWHGLLDRGRIEPGQRADLVLLNADPLANISNTQQIARVWVGGVEFTGVNN